ncbi:hypothetical protein [Streptomyces violaceus]|uniref:Uncharacterized protein n=1 Tax=Streptomyces violaceus TaxID=1936 RepID=A0ABZ1NK24_STRVL
MRTVLSERNLAYAGAVKVPADGRRERIQDGFLIPRKELGWYGRLLARTGAAGQPAFAGAGTEIAQYLTDKQGHKHYKQQTSAGSSSVRDARHNRSSVPTSQHRTSTGVSTRPPNHARTTQLGQCSRRHT